MNIIQWLNDEANDIILQREGTFALLSWRDFNQPAEPVFTLHTAVWLFLLGSGIPLLMLS